MANNKGIIGARKVHSFHEKSHEMHTISSKQTTTSSNPFNKLKKKISRKTQRKRFEVPSPFSIQTTQLLPKLPPFTKLHNDEHESGIVLLFPHDNTKNPRLCYRN